MHCCENEFALGFVQSFCTTRVYNEALLSSASQFGEDSLDGRDFDVLGLLGADVNDLVVVQDHSESGRSGAEFQSGH